MRRPRDLQPPDADRCYQVTSLVHPHRKLLRPELEEFQLLLPAAAEFFGIRILHHTLSPVAFTLSVLVPQARPLTDAEIQRRHAALYGLWPSRDVYSVDQVAEAFAQGGVAAQAVRDWFMARFGNLSLFMQQLKQRLCSRANRRWDTAGTLWQERFRSLYVELGQIARLAILSEWIAEAWGLDSPPGQTSTYTAALAGNIEAQQNLCLLMGEAVWEHARERYAHNLSQVGTVLGLRGQTPSTPQAGSGSQRKHRMLYFLMVLASELWDTWEFLSAPGRRKYHSW